MTNPTQIPASVIPELVEFLIMHRSYLDKDKLTGGLRCHILWEDSSDELRSALTAALEAFNERKTK